MHAAPDKICDDAWDNPLRAQNPVIAGQPVPAASAGHDGRASVGPKATRAAALMEKQRKLAMSAPAEQPKAGGRLSALEQARAFRRSVTATTTDKDEARGFREKMQQDPFDRLGR